MKAASNSKKRDSSNDIEFQTFNNIYDEVAEIFKDKSKDTTFQYNQMLWWRHFSRVNDLNWITTTEECRIEHEARNKRIKIWTHGTLQKMFGSYDISDSDDDE